MNSHSKISVEIAFRQKFTWSSMIRLHIQRKKGLIPVTFQKLLTIPFAKL